jgi:LysM repeat protein
VVPHYHVVVFPAYAQHLERHGIDLPASNGVVLAGLPPLVNGARELPTAMMPVAAVSTTTHRATPAATRSTTARRPSTTSAKHTTTRHSSTTTKRSSTTARRSTTTRRSTSARHASARRYKVRNGDNLWSIARKHGISVQAIRRANKVASARLRPGQVLAIPAK